MWIVGTLSGKLEGVFLFEIYTAGKAGLDLSRKFQTSPPMGTWNSGLTNSKFVAKLELSFPKSNFRATCGGEITQNRALRDRFHQGRAVQGICPRCPAAPSLRLGRSDRLVQPLRADQTSRRALVPTQLAPPWPQCPHPAFFSMWGPGQRPDLAIESFQRAIERDQSVTSP